MKNKLQIITTPHHGCSFIQEHQDRLRNEEIDHMFFQLLLRPFKPPVSIESGGSFHDEADPS